jgi:hypothetical protein
VRLITEALAEVELPESGKCVTCGRTVYLRTVGTTGTLGWRPELQRRSTFQWVARKGAAHRMTCWTNVRGRPVSYHHPEGFQRRYFGPVTP